MIELYPLVHLPTVITALKTVTLVLGAMITYFSYKAFRRTGAKPLGLLAFGFAVVTLGSLLAGVFDLGLQIWEATLSGSITDPNIVIGFIDVGLLLLIIVEIYQTVVAYIKENDTRRIVRLVIYTGVIAVVRKVIIFRTSEYNSSGDALIVAVAYGILTLGLVALLYVDRQTSNTGQ